jgi:hypothetical protein|tara:strand:- start:471 stop:785 length:315 start_codon:yes stop_codon:yes gene_type:complete
MNILKTIAVSTTALAIRATKAVASNAVPVATYAFVKAKDAGSTLVADAHAHNAVKAEAKFVKETAKFNAKYRDELILASAGSYAAAKSDAEREATTPNHPADAG